MIKSELIDRMAAEHPHLFHRDIEKIVQVLLDQVIEALASGKRVELRGFGAFTTKFREARTARNPKSGETVDVPAKYVPSFKTGKELHQRLNKPSPQLRTYDDDVYVPPPPH